MIVKANPTAIGAVANKVPNKSSNAVTEENNFPTILEKTSPVKPVVSVSVKEMNTRKNAPTKLGEIETETVPVLSTELAQFELTSLNPGVKLKKDADSFVDPKLQALQHLITENAQVTTPAPLTVPGLVLAQPAASEKVMSPVKTEDKQNTEILLSPLAEEKPLPKELSQASTILSPEDLNSKIATVMTKSPIKGKPDVERVVAEQHEAFLSMMKKVDGGVNANGGTVKKSEMMTPLPVIRGTHLLLTPDPGLNPHVAAIKDVSGPQSFVPPASPPALLNQALGTPAWQQGLSQQLSYFTRNGIHDAELRLHPDDLGKLKINLRLNNDQVQLHFITENHQVSAALEAAMPHLRTSLAESGINLGHSSVGAESSSSWNLFSQSEGSSSHSFLEDGAPEGGHVVEGNEAVEIRTIHYSGGINTFV